MGQERLPSLYLLLYKPITFSANRYVLHLKREPVTWIGCHPLYLRLKNGKLRVAEHHAFVLLRTPKVKDNAL